MDHTLKTDENPKDLSKLKPFVKKAHSDGEKYFMLLGGESSSKMHSGLVTLQPGESIGEHSTGDHEEFIVALSGSGEIEAEGMGRKHFEAGDVAYNPPQTKHNVMNNGIGIFSYIFIVSRA
jgi:quercetin dioxygenase-like cupin family protein